MAYPPVNQNSIFGDWKGYAATTLERMEEPAHKKFKSNESSFDEVDIYSNVETNIFEDTFNLDGEVVQGNWNQRFQSLLNSFYSAYLKEDKDIILQKISELVTQFSSTAWKYAKIIIEEYYCDNSTKRIQKTSLGGILGGLKFKEAEIIFKVSSPDDDFYSKITGHEFKSLEQLFACQMEDISLPLLAMIDYQGFRVAALSSMPVDNRTLVAGSSDSGKSIKTPPVREELKLRRMCSLLNLLPHNIKDKENREIQVFGPFDLEGHLVNDQLYLLDFSRLFPSDNVYDRFPCSDIERRYKPFVHLLRPEFVKQCKSPLCSDIQLNSLPWSNEKRMQAVEETHAALLEKIDQFVAKNSSVKGQVAATFEPKNYVELLHADGINLRYCGYLHHLFSSSIPTSATAHWLRFLKIEMVARVFKWIIRAKFRGFARSPDLLSVLQQLWQPYFSYDARALWHERVYPLFQRNFHSLPTNVPILSAEELYDFFFGFDLSSITAVVDRVAEMMGIVNLSFQGLSLGIRNATVQPVIKKLDFSKIFS